MFDSSLHRREKNFRQKRLSISILKKGFADGNAQETGNPGEKKRASPKEKIPQHPRRYKN